MISIGTRQHGAARRRPIDVRGDCYHKGEWMESGDDPVLSPTVFLIEQPPNATLVPHFHRQNQFQLFVDGGGTLGKHAVETRAFDVQDFSAQRQNRLCLWVATTHCRTAGRVTLNDVDL